mgnify:CR=1 FL=1
MDITWEGVVFIWVVFLWPVLLGGFYLAWKKNLIKSKGKFFVSSIAVGYAVLILGNFLGTALTFGFLKAAGISVESPNAETVVNILTAAIMAILLLLPVVSTHFIARRFS